LPLHKTNRTHDNNMSGVKTITKQALHHLAGQCLMSIQEAVHMVDNQELVISSNKMTYLSLAQGQALCDECDTHAKKDLITIHQNRQQKYNHLLSNSFIKSSYNQHSTKKNKKNSNIANNANQEQDILASNQHQILVPKGMNCTQKYPVDYAHAQGMLIMHKPWNKHNTLEHFCLNNKKDNH
jgi:hypothetical protein